MSKTLLFFACSLLFFASCVSNKKYVYLQKNDVNIDGLLKDSVVRTYALDQYDYRIQPDDIISVQFESLTPKDMDFLNSDQTGKEANNNLTQANALMMGELVDQQGEIPFPFIGKVKVAGFTIFQVQDSLQKLVSPYLTSPVVKVRLLNFRFTLLGEVFKEGTTILNNNRVSVLEALGWAGGLTDLADKANVKLIRKTDGNTTIQYINLLDENFINSPYYYIHQNDVIIVPSLKQRPFRKYFGQNFSLAVSAVTLVLLIFSITK
jgi:polysaccharide biosynthesis/export protein